MFIVRFMIPSALTNINKLLHLSFSVLCLMFPQVLTFDGRGVSGHANHIAIYMTLRHLASAGRLPEGCQIFSLHSISILRKYLSVLELPVSWLLPSDFCCIIGQEEYKRAKKAMLCHRSQLLWFRRLYILFSRYMLVNTFQAITVETKNVKIY